MRCIAFAGGGTAGHVFPGMAVAEKVSEFWPGRMIWIGSRSRREKRWLAGSSLIAYGIPSGKLRRYFSLGNISDVFRIIGGLCVSLAIIARERPALLFSKGGYVSVPPVVACWLLRVPVFTHESDVDPGLANRINARFSERIFISFRHTRRYFGPPLEHRVTCTGNPIRGSLLAGRAREGRKYLGCPPGRPVVLIMGGSQGARGINRLLAPIVPALAERCFVVHQMGRADYAAADTPFYYTAPFFGAEMGHVLACADLVISRAGANTVTELAALGKPAILIPLPLTGSRGDQVRNARHVATRGGALVFSEESGSAAELLEIVSELLDNEERLRDMAGRMKALGRPNASELIAGLLLERMKLAGWRPD